MSPGRGLQRVTARCCECGLRKASTRPIAVQHRSFTSSVAPQKHGAVPTFMEPSTPEQSVLLNRFRENIILPAHLPRSDTKAIYDRTRIADLERLPRVVELEGEEFTLKHVDKTRDVPNPRRDLVKLLSLMRDRTDWSNLPILLEGLKTAGVLPYDYLERIARKVALAGQQHLLIDAARRVDKTGFSLKSAGLLREVVWAMQWSAVKSGFGDRETARALRRVEQLDVMRMDPSHVAVNRTGRDTREKVDVVGVLLELAAVRAQKKGGNAEEELLKKVDLYARRVVVAWRMDGQPLKEDLAAKKISQQDWLRFMVPVQYGMKTSLEVLDPKSETYQALQPLEAELAAQNLEVKEALSSEGVTKGLGVWTYNKLIEGVEETEEEAQPQETDSSNE